ncbi:hypothetical protein [Thiolapillus sp.]|uniref:hypothetical protein n=1 Tax=Thiolapillus sp. TaxID=2017437 RepID=UPI0025DB26A9|nr:hypothetical protein [Thiolapillus sp.]
MTRWVFRKRDCSTRHDHWREGWKETFRFLRGGSNGQSERLSELGFFKRLVAPDDEKAIVDGYRELVLGD